MADKKQSIFGKIVSKIKKLPIISNIISEHNAFKERVKQSILTKDHPLSMFEQFREIFDFTCWPTIAINLKEKLFPSKKDSSTSSMPNKKNKSFIPKIPVPKVSVPFFSKKPSESEKNR